MRSCAEPFRTHLIARLGSFLPTPYLNHLQDDEILSIDTPEAESVSRRRCCSRWLAGKDPSRCGNRCGNAAALLNLISSCNCNEKAMARNLKLKENSLNASIAQERMNDTWIYVNEEPGLKPPANIQVLG